MIAGITEYEFGMSEWRTYGEGIKKEWLLTNGIGGYASSTVIGANTRRYHGLLIASLKPPVQRHLILSQIHENIEIEGTSYNLASFEAGSITMKGFHHQQRFVSDPLPVYIFSIADIRVEKTVCMVYGENTVTVLYHVVSGGSRVRLRLTPLVNFRDYHQDSHRQYMNFSQMPYDKGTDIIPYNLDREISLYCPEGKFTPLEDCWFLNMDYAVERERGLHSTEDHYIPGYFDIKAEGGQEKYVTFTAGLKKYTGGIDGRQVIKREKERRSTLIRRAGSRDEFASALVSAADNFIVYRKTTGAKTILAGYPWFTDWGRDAMISLSGLTLATGRFDDAGEILYTFSKYIRDGLLPNMFPDEGQEPAYNSVDASLWYFEAVNKYIAYTGNHKFVRDKLYTSMKEIIDAFISGTRFSIYMDSDCLLSAGNPETQLTWMDAMTDLRPVTPRHGKAVEINALWYNALRIMENLAGIFDENPKRYAEISDKAGKSFISSFWNDNDQCLYDVIGKGYKDASIRPNQVIAASLSYPVIAGSMARAVIRKVWEELYTGYGLRSLSPRSERYRGFYTGDPYARDSAYHQGTVWVWPLGHFITAYVRNFGLSGQYGDTALSFFKPFKNHLKDACIGNISEIFDADAPYRPRGCIAQAWSVAEILRSYTEDIPGYIK